MVPPLYYCTLHNAHYMIWTALIVQCGLGHSHVDMQIRSMVTRVRLSKLNHFSYIDVKLWEKTKALFPDEVTKRLQGESVDIPDKELDFSYVQSRQHYSQGELRKEYELEVGSALAYLFRFFRGLIGSSRLANRHQRS